MSFNFMAAVTIHSDSGAQENKMGFSGVSDCKESACNAGDLSSIPGSERSFGEGNGYLRQFFLPGKLCGQRSLVGYSPWGCKESDVTNSNIIRY